MAEKMRGSADPMETKALEVLENFAARVDWKRRRAWLVPKGKSRFAVCLVDSAPAGENPWPATTLSFDRLPESPELLNWELPWQGKPRGYFGPPENYDSQGKGSLGWALAVTGQVPPKRVLSAFPVEVLLGGGNRPSVAFRLLEGTREDPRGELAVAFADRLEREARKNPALPGAVLRSITDFAEKVNDSNAFYVDILLEWFEKRPRELDRILLRYVPPEEPVRHPWTWTADRFWEVFVDSIMLGNLPREKRARDARFVTGILGDPGLRTLNRSLDRILAQDSYPRAQMDLLAQSQGHESAAAARDRLRASRALGPSGSGGEPEPML